MVVRGGEGEGEGENRERVSGGGGSLEVAMVWRGSGLFLDQGVVGRVGRRSMDGWVWRVLWGLVGV